MQIDASSPIGFIGTGVMGLSMARNLLRAGHKLHVYSRTREKAGPLIHEGAAWSDTAGQVASACRVVITIVGFPSDVEEVYFGPQGLLASGKPGTVFIDMTTSRPDLARKISAAAAASGMQALDAPVSGGDIGAKAGSLSIMAGGDKAAFESILPVLEHMGKNIVYQGPAGSGQHTKMCNQIAIASCMMGVCESLIYAEKAGLNPGTVLKSISSGAAGSWALTHLAPRILKGDYEPGFYVKHFIKDLSIALAAAEEMGFDLPGLKTAKMLYDRLAAAGGGEMGTQALMNVYGG